MLKKWKLALRTVVIVAAIIAGKALVHFLHLEHIDPSSLFSSIIAGGVFLIGMILAGTMSDFKESEKIPAELVNSLESIYEEGQQARAKWPSFDLDGLRGLLQEIVTCFQADLVDMQSRGCLQAVAKLAPVITRLEELGLPANYIVRLKTEQSNVRKHVLRVYHIQRTNFIPSAYVLVDVLITLIIAVLIFTELGGFIESLVLTGFISYLFIYMINLLRTIDKPFHPEGHTMDDVSRFLLKEFHARLEEDKQREQAVTTR